MATIKAILFDLDGTLIDSEYFHFECWNDILSASGIQLTYDDWLQSYAGIPLETNAENIHQKYKLQTPLVEIISNRKALTLKRLNEIEVPLMHYVKEILDFFTAKELTLALVTGSPREDVNAIFAKNGLGKYFKTIVTSTDVYNNKPAPDCYELCIQKLGYKKEECLAFEDTVNGTKSAKAAGILCFAIQKHIQEHDKLAIADQVFQNFEMAINYIIINNMLKS